MEVVKPASPTSESVTITETVGVSAPARALVEETVAEVVVELCELVVAVSVHMAVCKQPPTKRKREV